MSPDRLHVLAATLLCTVATAAPKVAVVYCSWSGYAFKDELDPTLQALGWEYEKFENVAIGELVERLDQFDMVVGTGVSNYEHPQDMTPYREQWLKFLRRGGCLIITDASYGSQLDLWVNTFGGDFRLTTATCIAHREPSEANRRQIFAEHPLLTVPHDLAPVLQARSNIWAHLDSWGEAWQSLVTCADGKSLLVIRSVGHGLLIVTSHYKFLGEQGKAFGTALLENAWLYTMQTRTGLVVDQLAFGKAAPGPAQANLTLRNLTERDLKLRARVDTLAGEVAHKGQAIEAECASGKSTALAVPYVIAARGEVTARLVVEDADGALLLNWTRKMNIPPALRMQLTRKHLRPWQKEVQATLQLLPDAGLDATTLRTELLLDDKLAVTVGYNADDLKVTLPLDALGDGAHKLTARLMAGAEVVGEAECPFTRHPQGAVSLRSDGVTLVDGKPFFPFGFYHVSWGYTPEQRAEMVRDMGANGFNVAHVGIKAGELDSFGALLDEAQRVGVKICLEFGTDPLPVIAKYKDHPAVLTWNPGDEPDGAGVPPEVMFDRYDKFKQLDPHHLVYTTMCVPASYHRYVRGTDIAAPDPYPVPHAPVRMVWDTLSAAHREAAKYDTVVWAIPQCFGTYGPWTRPPTPAELRVMTYLALLAEMKGIIYYTYADGNWQVKSDPALWDAAKRLAAEVKVLAPALMDGRFKRLSEGNNGVYAGCWELNGVRYVMAANVEGKEASFEIPLESAAVELLFGKAEGIEVTEGKLRGRLEGMGTAVVKATQ